MTFYHFRFASYLYSDSILTLADETIGFLARFLFLSLFGIHYSSYQNKFKTKFKKLLSASVLVSFASYLFDPSNYIVWGVIHLFTLCAFIFRFIPKIIYLLGFISIFSLFIDLPYLSHNLFMILGFTKSSFTSYDYFPIFPFFSYVFVGILFKDYVIKKGVLKRDLPPNVYVTRLAQNSLLYYLIHIPIILLVHYTMM